MDVSTHSFPGASLSLLMTSANDLSLFNISAQEDELSLLESNTVEHLEGATEHSVHLDVSHVGECGRARVGPSEGMRPGDGLD